MFQPTSPFRVVRFGKQRLFLGFRPRGQRPAACGLARCFDPRRAARGHSDKPRGVCAEDVTWTMEAGHPGDCYFYVSSWPVFDGSVPRGPETVSHCTIKATIPIPAMWHPGCPVWILCNDSGLHLD